MPQVGFDVVGIVHSAGSRSKSVSDPLPISTVFRLVGALVNLDITNTLFSYSNSSETLI